jgi:hypothetical protein
VRGKGELAVSQESPGEHGEQGLASAYEALHVHQWKPGVVASACGAGPPPSAFPAALARAQLRKLKRGQAPCSAEQAKNKNRKNLERASRFRVEEGKGDATRRIPLNVVGRGCAVMRARVEGGWTPGPPFATHGDVGINALCSPTAMREWIAVVPGKWLVAQPARRAWQGGVISSNQAAAGQAFAARATDGATDGAALAPLTDAQRIAALTPGASSALDVPAWLTVFAGAAAAGEVFWA